MLEVHFGPFPVLETNRLRLRQMRHSDTQAFYALRSNEAIMKYIGRERPKTPDEVKPLIDKILSDYEQSEGISWAITPKETGAIIGTIGFWRIDKPNHRAEIGYLLHTDYWGKGIASEAMHAVLAYAFKELKFHAIEANVDPLNEASKKLLLRAGFVQEAYFRESYFFDGRFLDSAIFCLLHHTYNPPARWY